MNFDLTQEITVANTRRWTRTLLIAAAIFTAVALGLTGVFQLAVGIVPGYRQDLERLATEAVGQPLKIGGLAIRWRGYYPSLDLENIELLDAEGTPTGLAATQLRLAFSIPRMFKLDFTPNWIELSGLTLSVKHDDAGWHVQGVPSGASDDESSSLSLLSKFARLRLTDSQLNLHDVRLGPQPLVFFIHEVSLNQSWWSNRLSLRAQLPDGIGDSLEAQARLYGDVATPANWSGTFEAQLHDLQSLPGLSLLHANAPALSLNGVELALKGRLKTGALERVNARVQAQQLRAVRGKAAAELRGLDLSADLTPEPLGWQVQVLQLTMDGTKGRWEPAQGELHWAGGDAPAQVSAQFSFLRLEDLLPWAALWTPESPSWSLLRGDLRDLAAGVTFSDPLRYRLRSGFENLVWPAGTGAVGIDGAHGQIAADGSGGRLTLLNAPLTLELPRALKTAVPFESLAADVNWQRNVDGWQVSAPRFSWRVHGLAGRGDMSLQVPANASTRLKLNADFSAEQVARLKPFMPTHWGAGLQDWLNRGIGSARIPKARLEIDGPLDQFPFDQKNPQGRWALDLAVADAAIHYGAGWPLLRDLSAQLAFRGNALTIQAHRGNLLGVDIESVTARFRDFSDNQLAIEGRVRGDLGNYYEFLASSPLRPRFAGLIQRTRPSGVASTSLQLDIPLNNADATRVSGRVSLDDAALRIVGFDEPIRAIRGDLDFTATGIKAPALTAQLFGEPVRASLTPRRDGSSQLLAQTVLRAQAPVFNALAVPEPLRPRISGQARLRAQMSLGGSAAAGLTLDSDLAGLAVRLPSPLEKSAAALAPLQVLLDEPARGLRLRAEWRDRLGADLRWNDKNVLYAAHLRLGLGAAAAAPDYGVSISGTVSTFDGPDWRALVQTVSPGTSKLELRQVDLRAERWLWNEYVLPQTRAQAQPTTDGWRVVLAGSGAQGEARWQREGTGRLELRLANLRVNRNAAAAALTPDLKTPTAVQDPAQWPLLDADIGRFDWDAMNWGRVLAKTARIPGGLRLAQLQAQDGEADLQAAGQWVRREGQSSATLTVRAGLTDFGDLLRATGFAPNLEAKTARINGQLAWPPNPRGLDWTQARGPLSLEFENGRLRSIEPGAGRVLGLINFYALPRRLTLNFRDVTSSGFGYDTIRGSFDLADGNARTDDLEVNAPSVRIKINGRIGLAARDYDQRVTIYPGLSSGVTIGAAVLGGPIAAAIALVAQEVLNKPLEKLTELDYRVTGGWDNPKIDNTAVGPISR